MLVGGVLGQSGGFGGLEEGRLADLALDVAGLLVHLELRLGNLALLLVAITLLLSLGAVTHGCCLVG